MKSGGTGITSDKQNESAEAWLRACLKLANYRDGVLENAADDRKLNAAYRYHNELSSAVVLIREDWANVMSADKIEVIMQPLSRDFIATDLPPAAKTTLIDCICSAADYFASYRDSLRVGFDAALDALASKRMTKLRTCRAKANVWLDDLEVTTTRIELHQDGRLDHHHRYQPKNRDAIRGLLWAFLLDPTRPFGDRLRRCHRDSCVDYFFMKHSRTGGGTRKYCSEECAESAERHLAAKRVQKYRKRQAKLNKIGKRK